MAGTPPRVPAFFISKIHRDAEQSEEHRDETSDFPSGLPISSVFHVKIFEFQAKKWHTRNMRLIAFVLITFTVLAGCATSPPSASDQANICSIFDGRKSWYRAAAKAQDRWGTSIALQMAIIKTESNFKHDARPPRGRRRFFGILRGERPSSARGFAQALDGTWEEYKASADRPRANRETFSDATDFVGWYTARSSRSAGIAITDARAQYLAYHEGAGGFTRGSWHGNTQLIAIADRVKADTATFTRQLGTCERKLKRRGLFG